MNWGFLHTGKNFLARQRKTKLTLVIPRHLQIQIGTIHWEFIILCKNSKGITWTQRSMAFLISMPNSTLLCTLNHWHQEIYLRQLCSKSACQSGKWSCKNVQLYCNELCGFSDNCANICPINDEVDVGTQEDSN